MGEPLDLSALRRLALLARDDDHDETCAARFTTCELALARALDPERVIALLDRLQEAEQRAKSGGPP